MILTLKIETDNAGMQTPVDAAVALERVAKDLREGNDTGAIRDVNGNRVGDWSAIFPEVCESCGGLDGEHESGCRTKERDEATERLAALGYEEE